MAIDIFPHNFHNNMNLGSTYSFFGDYEQALEVYLNCVKKFTGSTLFGDRVKNIWIEVAITYYL